jgi:hypothetical protein
MDVAFDVHACLAPLPVLFSYMVRTDMNVGMSTGKNITNVRL